METILTPHEYHTLLRNDLYIFIIRCFAELNPGATFMPNWHLELVAAILTECLFGDTPLVIINIPPRYLKSISATVAMPAFFLGHNPAAQIICASYAQELSEKLARDCRTIMMTRWYKQMFATRLSGQRHSVQEFVTTGQGFRLATSVGGVLTGRGADLLVVDDPLKPEQAVSDVQRRKVNDLFDSTLLSRLNDKRTGRIVIVMHRLHEDHLVGHVSGSGDWKVLRLSAIAEEEEEHEFRVFRTTRRVIRHIGEPLHPAREPRSVLDYIRARLRRLLSPRSFGCRSSGLKGGSPKSSRQRRHRRGWRQ